MSESLINELVGKRIVVGFKSHTGMLQMTVATLDGFDGKFLKLRTSVPKDPNEDPMIINANPDVITYSSMDGVDTITDATDDKIYNMIMRQMDMAQRKMQAAAAAQQQGYQEEDEDETIADPEQHQEKDNGTEN